MHFHKEPVTIVTSLPCRCRSIEEVGSHLGNTWHQAHCRLAVRIQHQEGLVVAQFQPSAVAVRLWSHQVLMHSEERNLLESVRRRKYE